MPIWVLLLVGAGTLWLIAKNQAAPSPALPGSPSTFYVGQIVNVPDQTHIYSDAGLTSDVGVVGGAMTVKVVDPANRSLGLVGPTGQGLGGGAPAYVGMEDVRPSLG